MVETRSNYQAGVMVSVDNIPNAVIDLILMKLPTRDAVRTSILCRKWRYRWAELPQFIFDHTLSNTLVAEESISVKFTRIMYHFMSTHKGHIQKFILSVPELEGCPEVDNLILFLSRNNIEDLTLEMWEQQYLLPSSIFTCQQLKRLYLEKCLISLPPTSFNGFAKLASLELTFCGITSKALRTLISKSPSLEKLHLSPYSQIGPLYIDAPNLRTFAFDGPAISIIFRKVPLLASVSVNLFPAPSSALEWSLHNFFRGLPAVECLCVNDHFAQRFAIREPEVSSNLVHLKHLKLSKMSFMETRHLQFTLNIMRSSPNLESIEIKFYHDISSNSMATPTLKEGQDNSDIWLSELKDVKLYNVRVKNPELLYIKLLLAKSPALKRILIETATSVRKMRNEVSHFRRRSREAQVLYKPARRWI